MLVGCAAASAVPLRRHDHLPDRAPPGIWRTCASAVEIAAAEARLASLEHHACQYCGFEVEKAFLRCPSCLRRLKEPCTVCGKPLDPRWKICPYCEAEVGQAAPEGRRPRPRRASLQPPARARQWPGRHRRPARALPRTPRSSARRRGRGVTAPSRPAREGPMDRTLILVKPDAFERGLTGEIVARFGTRLRIVAMKHMTVTRELAEQHAGARRGSRSSAASSWLSSPVARSWRSCSRATRRWRRRGRSRRRNPLESSPGSIRGDFGLEVQTNLVHGSDSPESAARDGALLPRALTLVLASRSPQRKAILGQLGVRFTVCGAGGGGAG